MTQINSGPIACSAAVVATLGLFASLTPALAERLYENGRPSHALTIRHHNGERWRHPAPSYNGPVAEPIGIPIDPTGTVVFQTPFFAVSSPDGPDAIVRVPHYQGPDGTYDSLSDFTNAINGTPCGQECTDRSLVRWGYRPVY